MSGTLPSSLSQLVNLEFLYIFRARLTGTIPVQYSSLTKLKGLVLTSNFLSNTIPPELGQLSNLLYMAIGYSDISGTIPPELSALTNLLYLSLFYSKISGTIPTAIQSMSSIEELNLNDNLLSGTIPPFLGNLPALKILGVDDNLMDGTVPSELSSLTSLERLYVYGNSFTSISELDFSSMPNFNLLLAFKGNFYDIPVSLCSATAIQGIDLSRNIIQSSIPSCFGELKSMVHVELSDNQISGSLPPTLGNWTNITYFNAERNALSGTIGQWVGQLTRLETMRMRENLLTGSLPNDMSKLSELSLLDLESNLFTGALPNSFEGLSRMHHLYLGNNSFDGRLPHSVGNLSLMKNFRLQNNEFVGILPTSIVQMRQIGLLDISDNEMTGYLPSEVSQLSLLQYLLIQNNHFVGEVGNVFNNSNQKALSNIDFSGNLFTGQLPSSIFENTRLTSFGAVSNCFSGTLPDEICDAGNLEVFAVDGMSVTSLCSSIYVSKSWMSEGSYGMEHVIDGTIPSCLFEMSNLRVLHLSGIGIDTTIPETLNLGSSLVDLSLSHNLMKGSIPYSIQNNSWINLDLSFNRFSGTLHESFANVSDSGALSLAGNHLSGKLPQSVINAQNVSVLEGNLFACDLYDSSTLPSSDDSFETYECGNSINQVGVFWAIPYFVVVGIAIVCVCFTVLKGAPSRAIHLRLESMKQWLECFDESKGTVDSVRNIRRTSPLRLFKSFVLDWVFICCVITAILIFCVMPLWIWLSFNFKTYEHSYAWVTTVAYLSGSFPAILGTSIFVVLLIIFFLLSRRIHVSHSMRRTSLAGDLMIKESFKFTFSFYCVVIGVIVLNSALVLFVNVLFIIINLQYSPTVVTICTILLTIFELIWNGYCVPSVMSRVVSKFSEMQNVSSVLLSNRRQAFVLVLMELINNIVIPFLAAAFVTPTCFYHLIFRATSVSTSYKVSVCFLEQTLFFACREVAGIEACDIFDSSSYDCTGIEQVEVVNSFTPPFYYSFQCSSTFLDNYVAVFLYSYLIIAFVIPTVTLVLMRIRAGAVNTPRVVKFVDSLLPSYMRSWTDVSGSSVIFDQVGFIVSAVGDAVVLLTFGAVFPPLAICICVGVLSRVMYVLFGIGRLLHNVKLNCPAELRNHQGILMRDCQGITELYLGIIYNVVLPFTAVFFSFFVFDTMGYEHGWISATMLAVPIALCPALLLLLFFLHQYILKKRIQISNDHALLDQANEDNEQQDFTSSSAGKELPMSPLRAKVTPCEIVDSVENIIGIDDQTKHQESEVVVRCVEHREASTVVPLGISSVNNCENC